MVPVPEVTQCQIVLAFDIFALVVSTCELPEDDWSPSLHLERQSQKMTTFRRVLLGLGAVGLACSMASADTIYSTSAVVTFATDGSYTLTMNKFDHTLGTLTGATLYFSASEDVTSLSLANSSSSVQSFDMVVQSNPLLNSSNTANNADRYTGEIFDIFDTGIGPNQAQFPTSAGSITLGPAGSGTCPLGTPSSACSTVFYTPPDLTISNTDAIYGANVGTGIGAVTGVKKTISSANLHYYLDTAGPTFALTGTTYGSFTVGGGGNNVVPVLHTTATFAAEIDYTYTVPPPPSSTPEPATLVLMGTALAGVGLLRKRIKG